MTKWNGNGFNQRQHNSDGAFERAGCAVNAECGGSCQPEPWSRQCSRKHAERAQLQACQQMLAHSRLVQAYVGKRHKYLLPSSIGCDQASKRGGPGNSEIATLHTAKLPLTRQIRHIQMSRVAIVVDIDELLYCVERCWRTQFGVSNKDTSVRSGGHKPMHVGVVVDLHGAARNRRIACFMCTDGRRLPADHVRVELYEQNLKRTNDVCDSK